MDISSIMKKVKLVEVKTRRDVDNLFAGGFHSRFKGQGLDFSEVREYVEGDDVKNIDWKVSARTNDLYIKRYHEERELNIILAVDISQSQFFGSDSTKKDLLAELVSLLGFSAIKDGNRVGLMSFGDKIENYMEPKKGNKHVMALISNIYSQGKSGIVNFELAIKHLRNVLKRKAIVIFISDYLFDIDDDLIKKSTILSKKHDVLAIQLVDKRENDIPKSGFVKFRDIENGQSFWVNTNSKKFIKDFEKKNRERDEKLLNYFKRTGIKSTKIKTDEDYIGNLLSLFR